MYELTRLFEMVMYALLVYLFTPMLYPIPLPHWASHWGKTHFPISICSTTHYTFRFTPLEYNEVKPKVPSSRYDRYFAKKVHEKYLYPGQSDVLPIPWHRWFDSILSFAQVASMKESKRGSNAVWMRIKGFTPRGVKLSAILLYDNNLCLSKEKEEM
jgi:hypothetical protein